MAMPLGSVLISDKMQFPNNGGGGGGGSGGEICPMQWVPDERDGLISWLRGEFAASNVIIDSLCHHLSSIGEPGEYDVVIRSIQQRRSNWSSVLHMQQYFPVGEVMVALNEVYMRKKHRHFGQMKVSDKGLVKSSPLNSNFDKNSSSESVNVDLVNGIEEEEMGWEDKYRADNEKSEGKEGLGYVTKFDEGNRLNSHPETETNGSKTEVVSNGCISTSTESFEAFPESTENVIQNNDEKQNRVPTFKTFVGTEIYEGKEVNVVEGLRLFEKLVDESETLKLTSLANELREGGRRGQLKGQAFVVSKRPMKGNGREMIQLGLPIANAPLEDQYTASSSIDRKMEPIPGLLQDVIDQLFQSQIISVIPDCCIIDFFNEGDHSQPYTSPSWFGRPVCVLFLTECNVSFGRVIVVEHPGDYRGSVNLSLSPGSLLSMEGKSANFAKHAISSLPKPRILVTFTNSQPKKHMVIPSAPQSPLPWASPPTRPSSQFYHDSKHFGPIPTTPSALIHVPPHLPLPNGVQPLFVPTPVPPPGPYPAPGPLLPPGSAGWVPVFTPRHYPPPRFILPGTGVFLPPPGSSCNSSTPCLQQAASTGTNPALETQSAKVNGNKSERSNCLTNFSSPEDDTNGNLSNSTTTNATETSLKVHSQESNGSVNSTSDATVVAGNEEQQQSANNIEKKTASKTARI